jgi:hypothetical protein
VSWTRKGIETSIFPCHAACQRVAVEASAASAAVWKLMCEFAILTRTYAVVSFISALPVDPGRRSALIRFVSVVEHWFAAWVHVCESAVGFRRITVETLKSAGFRDGACVASLTALVEVGPSVASCISVGGSATRELVGELAV